ncbi:conjugative transfer system coupling protein TraD [Thiocapsa marina]|uniref:Conjugative coupling factor TraD, SXT/TOL subfamily n=1 Tax=Thiocapsa marina 5811 TaxID=768671 RepID=F9UAG9_9GAMM|nr:conjugative transfer system coupling protein TraD [Thiocapsa marina]EGV18499.1 conjugative coupling factor TraD, SXT/TOL subfamily [Thiocapsa marina 5811]EGV19117.1 conjugative coupling factor TraD, SXT/TOL subfamily [Thiocapsa marina 5811]
MRTYANPWRPLFELPALLLWTGIAAVSWATAELWDLHAASFRWLAVGSLVMALTWLPGTVRGINRRDWLRGRPQQFIDPQVFAARVSSWPGLLWMGRGFDWEARHAQEALDLIRLGPERFAPRDPARLGATWIHGLGGADAEVTVPLAHTEGHVLIVGTTGCGKTRLFDLLVTQAVLRGDAVVILDPKGDRGLRAAAERACALAGTPQRFVSFHPAFPAESVRLDPLRHFQRATELASRVAALIPSETGNDPFKAFGQMALSHAVHGMLAVEERPTLVTLRRYLEGGADALVERVLHRYFDTHLPHWQEHAGPYLNKARDANRRARGLLAFYRERVRGEHPSTVIDGLGGLLEHEAVHFGKMVASLMPVIVMLTSGHLEGLLSPDETDANDPRRAASIGEIIARREVLYVGLDSLSDPIVGSAIGSMLTADLAAVAGSIYNHEAHPRPTDIFIDEAAETVSDPLIQLLNKGRGAGLRLTIATQTFADFAARMGSEEKARQVLGNLNGLIAMRVIDAKTQEYIAESLPAVRLCTVVKSQGSTTASDRPLLYTGNAGERLDEAEAPLFPAALLGELPNFEYLARWPGGRVSKGRLPILGEPLPPPTER